MTDDDYEYVPQIAPGVLDARLELREAEREMLIAKIASMANERDMFAAKVNQDMDELVAAAADMVRAISDLPRH